MTKTVHVVSLGPGDPELLTLGALRSLREADAIYLPATVDAAGRRSSRAADILAGADPALAGKFRPFALPMKRDRSAAREAYRAAAEAIAADPARTVVLTAEGDAGIYSSAHYVGDLLARRGIEVRYRAGIPAFVAAGAAAGVHLVHNDETLEVRPVVARGEIEAAVGAGRTVVVMKPSQSEAVVKRAVEALPTARWLYFENIGSAGEYRTEDRAAILARTFPYFSIVIVRS